ncbi:MAG: hypothetical protein JW845_06410 [Dehalococcoidales bacterium]|nr:hypothetical protein [Dehalococcoidales bacterium]
MSQGDWYILLIVGGVFIVLGIGAVIWGIREEKKIFEELSKMPDLREFSMEHIEPQPGALKIGGWIASGLGLIMIIVGIILWRVG